MRGNVSNFPLGNARARARSTSLVCLNGLLRGLQGGEKFCVSYATNLELFPFLNSIRARRLQFLHQPITFTDTQLRKIFCIPKDDGQSFMLDILQPFLNSIPAKGLQFLHQPIIFTYTVKQKILDT